MKVNKRFLLITYTLVLAAILYYPVRTIQRVEFPVRKPLAVKFRVSLYDPYDPMRGRFVRLRVLPDEYVSNRDLAIAWKETVYAVIGRDPAGMAKIIRLEKDLRKIGKDEYFIRLASAYEQYGAKNKNTYAIKFPFQRFYLNELKAPELERALSQKAAGQNFLLEVRISRDGFWAVSGLERAVKK